MSPQLKDLLFTMRQHAAFQELLKSIEAPTIKAFRESDEPDKHMAQHIFRSGRRLQHAIWCQFLTGDPTSEQEKS
jgi:hypothetical protein